MKNICCYLACVVISWALAKKCECPWFHIPPPVMSPPCAVVHVCVIGCVYQSVPRDSGGTAGDVRDATHPARAAPGVAVTSALPVKRAIT